MSRTPTRKSGPERREEIALAALRIMGRQGLQGLTTAVLAREVGLTSGALFRHFASRDAILEEAVHLAEARVLATFPDPELPALDRLLQLARARVRLLSEEPAVAWLLRSGQAQTTLPPSAVKRLRGLVRRSRRTIRDALGEAIDQGLVRADVAPDVLLLIYTATVHALVGKPGGGGRANPSTAAVEGLLTLLAPSETTKPGR